MATAFRDVLASTLSLVNTALAPSYTVSGIYAGEREWGIDILDEAQQGDGATLWSGANIDNVSRLFVYNGTGWDVGVSPNGNGLIDLTPHSFCLLSLAGTLSRLQSVANPLTNIDYELTSVAGAAGKLYVVMLGVQL